MFRKTLPIFFRPQLLLALALLIIMALPAQAHAWAKYQSQNFTVYTDRSERQIRNLLEELEIFRVIALLQLNLPVAEHENKRLVIVMFRNNREFQRIMGERNVAGFFSYSSNGPRMVMGAERGNLAAAKEILFHEYVHYLMFEHSAGFTYPRWYIEGLAELLGATKVERDSVVVGGRPATAAYMDYYGILGMEDLLQNRGRGERSDDFEGRFYATAWLLTHYVQIDAAAAEQQMGLKNREYLIRYHQGADSVTAFEEVFDTSLAEFDRMLSRYARQRRITVRNWTKPDLNVQLTRTAISETEKNYVLADMASATGNEGLALEYLTGTSEGEDYYAEALALQALLLNHDEETAGPAAQLATQAANQPSASATAFGSLAHYEFDNYLRLAADGQYLLANDSLERAEARARRAIDMDPREFDALWYLASVMQIKDQPDAALQLLDAAWDAMPANVGVRLRIADILIRRGEIDDAIPLVRSMVGAVHTAELSDRYAELLAQMERGDVDLRYLDRLMSAEN